MGRPYRNELEMINVTYEHIVNSDVSLIEEFFYKSYNNSLLTLGSGGSYSVAETVAFLAQKSGLFNLTKSITPYDLVNYSKNYDKKSIILLTASGNNKDILNAYKNLCDLDANSIIAVCMREKSKIKSYINNYNNKNHYLFENSLPNGKDGFLAVNSLLATIIVISKALYNITKNPYFYLDYEKKYYDNLNYYDINEVLQKNTIVVLTGGITSPVGVDLESKFTESGFNNIQLTNFRNFAHGRHNWISSHYNDVSILSLEGPEEKRVANKILNLIPNEVPRVSIQTEYTGVTGLLDLYIQMFYLIGYVGEKQGVDPGKPHVAEFGRKLYNMSYKPKIHKKSNGILNRSVDKKFGDFFNENLHKIYLNQFEKFLCKIKNTQFNGIIFDYDGTLRDKNADSKVEELIFKKINELLEHKIEVYIVTGRGKSVRYELKQKIDSKYWDRLVIGYYNGGEFGLLSNDSLPDVSQPVWPSLKKISERLDDYNNEQISYDLRPKQLTIYKKELKNIVRVNLFLKFICNEITDVKYYESGHSIDIIPSNSGKLSVFNNTMKNMNYLCIGDSGHEEGNDFELLSSTYSLSVDKVSKSINTCWNFSPLDKEGISASLYYLNLISVFEESIFRLNIKEL